MGEKLGATVPDVLLGVDLGTSNTVAVLRWRSGHVRPLLIDGASPLPSAIFADPSGGLVVGVHAQRLAGLDPARFEPNPKRRIDEPSVLLGPAEIATTNLLAALLASVGNSAVEAVGFLPPAVLTYPAAWGPRRRAVLAEAAQRAGWPPSEFVPEPVAAARYFSDILRRPVPIGGYLAVFDFGGGTLDVAVVRNEGGEAGGPRFVVAGSGGLEDLGGLDIDEALVNTMGRVIEARDPQVWKAINQPTDAAQRRMRAAFWADVRGAKEMLSRVATAPIAVPGQDEAVHLTRDELEQAARPLLARATAETSDVIGRCGIRPDQLSGLFLVGGSSRLPLVARMLHSELGIAPTVLEQPELPVAEGSLAELAPRLWSRDQEPTAQISPAPVAGPTSPAPSSSQPPSRSAFSASPTPAPPPGTRRPWYRRTKLVAGMASALVIALVGAGALLLWRNQSKTLEFVAPMEDGPSLEIGETSYSTEVFTAVNGDLAYVGLADDEDQLQLGALDLAGNSTAWDLRSVDVTVGEWDGIAATSKGLVLRASSSGDDPGMVVVCDPTSGEVRWQREIGNYDSLVYSSSALILGSDEDSTTYALDWSNGDTRWSVTNPDEDGDLVDATTFLTVIDSDLSHPSSLGDPVSETSGVTGSHRLLQLTDDQRLVVRDVDSGEEERTLSGVGASLSEYLALNQTLYITGSQTSRVEAFDLTSSGTPSIVYQADSGETIEEIVPQSGGRILILVSGQDTDRLVAVETEDNSVAWQADFESVTDVVPVGEDVFVVATGDTGNVLLDAEGTDQLSDEYRDSTGVRVGDGALLLFGTSTMSTVENELSLTGITTDPFAVTPLGDRTLIGSTCSWTGEYLACASDGEFKAWRFAKET